MTLDLFSKILSIKEIEDLIKELESLNSSKIDIFEKQLKAISTFYIDFEIEDILNALSDLSSDVQIEYIKLTEHLGENYDEEMQQIKKDFLPILL